MSAPLTSISSYVKRFESRGHITRVPNPRDGRSYRIRLTTAGHATHQTAGKLFQPVLEHVERTLDKPPPDVRTALQSLYRALPTA
jgi:DNA-binding MarR family transcriptional regulator